jgi:hypothetical protein
MSRRSTLVLSSTTPFEVRLAQRRQEVAAAQAPLVPGHRGVSSADGALLPFYLKSTTPA